MNTKPFATGVSSQDSGVESFHDQPPVECPYERLFGHFGLEGPM